MKILANKSNLYNTAQFLNQIYQKDFIDGAVFSVIMTKDNQIVVFNAVSNNQTIINTLQNKTYAQIQAEDVMTLDSVLSYLKGISKKIVLSLIPLAQPLSATNTLKEIARRNEIYIENVKKVIDKHPDLELYLASVSNKLTYHMKKHITDRKLGLILYPESTGYEDLDFYIFSSILYDADIFLQQLNRNKELMIYVFSCEDITRMYDFYFNKNVDPREKRVFEQIYYITEAPEILHQLFEK